MSWVSFLFPDSSTDSDPARSTRVRKPTFGSDKFVRWRDILNLNIKWPLDEPLFRKVGATCRLACAFRIRESASSYDSTRTVYKLISPAFKIKSNAKFYVLTERWIISPGGLLEELLGM